MTDQNSQFFAILTAVGEAKQANANALGVPWTFAQMGVGDANNTDPVPSRTQTKLINERRRAPLNQLSVDPKDASIIIAEQVIPPDVGGWWIREIGLYDAAGDLVAVANCAPSYKPLLAQGTGKTQVVRLNLMVTSTANVQLKIDPAVVLATRDYVDSSILAILPPNKTAGTYTQVKVNERGVVLQGSNPTTLAGYGITDALPKGAGGVLSSPNFVRGKISDLDSTQFISVANLAVDKPTAIPYGVGVHIKYPAEQYAVDFVGSITSDWYGARHVLSDGTPGAWRAFWHDGNFNPGSKADKSTTLSGYGITDAMPKDAGGWMSTAKLVTGPLAALPASQFVSVGPETTDAPAALDYGTGFHIKYPENNYSFEMLAGMNRDWVGFRRVDSQGIGTWQKLWHEGNFNPDGKADKSTTLSGYGITDAMPKYGGGLLSRPDAVQGRISAIPETRFISTGPATEDRPAGVTYAVGTHVTWGGGEQSVDFLGALNGKEEFYARTVYQGAGTFRRIWTEANFDPATKANLASPVFTGTPRVPNATTGTATDQAANTKFVTDAITALVASSPATLDTLNKLAAALGNDANFSTTVSNQLATKFNKSGGAVDGAISINLPNQVLGNPCLALNNPGTSASTQAMMTLACGSTSISLVHKNQDPSLHLLNGSGALQALNAGTLYSNGAAAHTSATFLKPASGQWVTLNGSGQLPSGGSWAYHCVGYNGSGQALGALSGVAAGGTVVGYNSNTVGFAWRIQ